MEIYMELNKRHGHGFQLRLLHGPIDKTFDEEPWTMYEAGAAAQVLLEEFNKAAGTDYQLHQVARVPDDALTVNAATDFAAARMLQDIRDKQYDLSVPAGCDCKTMKIDGKDELMVNARGTVLIFYFAWKDEGNQKAHYGLRRYCEYISAHGCKGGASKALAELEAFEDKDDAVAWIRRTFARYVADQNALMETLIGVFA